MRDYTKLPYKFNGALLSKMVKQKMKIGVVNGKPVYKSLTKTALEVGCGRVTIDRAKKGVPLEAVTLYAICVWLDKKMETFFTKSKK